MKKNILTNVMLSVAYILMAGVFISVGFVITGALFEMIYVRLGLPKPTQKISILVSLALGGGGGLLLINMILRRLRFPLIVKSKTKFWGL